jgi:hypothetical protein
MLHLNQYTHFMTTDFDDHQMLIQTKYTIQVINNALSPIRAGNEPSQIELI